MLPVVSVVKCPWLAIGDGVAVSIESSRVSTQRRAKWLPVEKIGNAVIGGYRANYFAEAKNARTHTSVREEKPRTPAPPSGRCLGHGPTDIDSR